jgi:hypothetical protein
MGQEADCVDNTAIFARQHSVCLTGLQRSFQTPSHPQLFIQALNKSSIHLHVIYILIQVLNMFPGYCYS